MLQKLDVHTSGYAAAAAADDSEAWLLERAWHCRQACGRCSMQQQPACWLLTVRAPAAIMFARVTRTP